MFLSQHWKKLVELSECHGQCYHQRGARRAHINIPRQLRSKNRERCPFRLLSAADMDWSQSSEAPPPTNRISTWWLRMLIEFTTQSHDVRSVRGSSAPPPSSSASFGIQRTQSVPSDSSSTSWNLIIGAG